MDPRIIAERKRRSYQEAIGERGVDIPIGDLEKIITKYDIPEGGMGASSPKDVANKAIDIKQYLDRLVAEGQDEIMMIVISNLIKKHIRAFSSINHVVMVAELFSDLIIRQKVFFTERETNTIIEEFRNLLGQGVQDQLIITALNANTIAGLLKNRQAIKVQQKIKKDFIGFQRCSNDIDLTDIPKQFIFKYKIHGRVICVDIRLLKRTIDSNYYKYEDYMDDLGNNLDRETVARINDRWKFVDPCKNISGIGQLEKLRTKIPPIQNLMLDQESKSWHQYYGIGDNSNLEASGACFAYLPIPLYHEIISLEKNKLIVIEVSLPDMTKTIYCTPYYDDSLQDGKISFSPQVYSQLGISPEDGTEVYTRTVEVGKGTRIKIQPLSGESMLPTLDIDSLKELVGEGLNIHSILSTNQIVKIPALNEFIRIFVEPQCCIDVRGVEVEFNVDMTPVLDMDIDSETVLMMIVNNFEQIPSQLPLPDHPKVKQQGGEKIYMQKYLKYRMKNMQAK